MKTRQNHRMHGSGGGLSVFEINVNSPRPVLRDKMLPYHLNSGLMLEDSNLILRWSEHADELSASADFWHPINDHLVFAWSSRRMLGGLRGNATTKLRNMPDATPTGFKLGLSTNDHIGATLAAAYDLLHAELVARFGNPTHLIKTDYSAQTLWTLGAIDLRHEFWDGFGGDHFVLIYPATNRRQHNNSLHLSSRLGAFDEATLPARTW